MAIVLLFADGMALFVAFYGSPECDHTPLAFVFVARCMFVSRSPQAQATWRMVVIAIQADISLRVLVKPLSAIRRLETTSPGLFGGGVAHGNDAPATLFRRAGRGGILGLR